MDPVILGILIILLVLVILILILLYKEHQTGVPGDLSAKFDASLNKQFLAFQSTIYRELNTTREEVTRSKDILSANTIKAIET